MEITLFANQLYEALLNNIKTTDNAASIKAVDTYKEKTKSEQSVILTFHRATAGSNSYPSAIFNDSGAALSGFEKSVSWLNELQILANNGHIYYINRFPQPQLNERPDTLGIDFIRLIASSEAVKTRTRSNLIADDRHLTCMSIGSLQFLSKKHIDRILHYFKKEISPESRRTLLALRLQIDQLEEYCLTETINFESASTVFEKIEKTALTLEELLD